MAKFALPSLVFGKNEAELDGGKIYTTVFLNIGKLVAILTMTHALYNQCSLQKPIQVQSEKLIKAEITCAG